MTIPNFGRNLPIPVTFQHKGKTYHGQFEEVSGAAGYMWNLLVDGFHRGVMAWAEESEPGKPRELKDAKYTLRFSTQTGDLDYLGEEFAQTLMAWFE